MPVITERRTQVELPRLVVELFELYHGASIEPWDIATEHLCRMHFDGYGQVSIHVKMLTGKSITLSLSPHAPVGILYLMMQQEEGYMPAKLIFAGKELVESDRSFADYNIQNNSTGASPTASNLHMYPCSCLMDIHPWGGCYGPWYYLCSTVLRYY